MASIDPYKSKTKRLMKSFRYALNGILATAKSEMNFRIHLVASVFVIVAGVYFQLSHVEWIVLFLLIGGMLSLELMNTAIEHVVDLVTEEYKPLAKLAKDAGAGAVFVFSIISVIIGLIIFLPKIYTIQ